MANGFVAPFAPSSPANTVTISASTTAATATLPGTGENVLVFNATTGIAFVRVDGSTATATTSDIPVPAGARMMLNCGSLAIVAAVILSTGTGNVYFTRGSGTQY